MSDKSSPIFGPAFVLMAIFFTYCSGYMILRSQCTGRPPFLVVPSQGIVGETLLFIYKPVFLAERWLTGTHFSTSPWGMDVGF